jgi:hypothetical protein
VQIIGFYRNSRRTTLTVPSCLNMPNEAIGNRR